jgi:A/G-specific adenine glycosylase
MLVETAPSLTNMILAHYDVNARVLPWRSPPRTPPPDPYRVWLSEVMLQQTMVAAVKAYFERFTTRWPDVRALAAADDGDVMAEWAGLGYYARARNLLACARVVANDHAGQFPDTEEGLRRLPGIGPYTAAAIAAIAFHKRAVVVDGNVERVITRLYAVATPLPAAKPEIGALMDALTPDVRAGDFAQAVMDLGATICTPRTPACILCPVAEACKGRTTAERYPIKRAKPVKPERSGVAWWIEREGKVLLVRRPDKGLLGGMRALPGCDWRGTGVARASDTDLETLGHVTHVFTHFRLTLHVARVTSAPDTQAHVESIWWPIDRLHEAGLPTVFAKAAKLAMSRRDA